MILDFLQKLVRIGDYRVSTSHLSVLQSVGRTFILLSRC